MLFLTYKKGQAEDRRNIKNKFSFIIKRFKNDSRSSSIWKIQLKQMELWEERYKLVLKIASIKNTDEIALCNKRLYYIDESLSQIKKEMEDMEGNIIAYKNVSMDTEDLKKERLNENIDKILTRDNVSEDNISNKMEEHVKLKNEVKDTGQDMLVNKKKEEKIVNNFTIKDLKKNRKTKRLKKRRKKKQRKRRKKRGERRRT